MALILHDRVHESILILLESGREHVEAVSADYLLPLPPIKADADAEAQWVDRLLVVCGGLSASAFESLMSLTNLSDP